MLSQERIRDYYAEAMCNYGEYDPEELLDEAVLYDHPLAPYTNGDSEVRTPFILDWLPKRRAVQKRFKP